MISGNPHVLVEAFGKDPGSVLEELSLHKLEAQAKRDAAWPDDSIISTRVLLLLPARRRLGLIIDRIEGSWHKVLDSGTHLLISTPPEDIDLYQDWISKRFSFAFPKVPDLGYPSLAVITDRPRDAAYHIALLLVKRGRPPSLALDFRPHKVVSEHKVLISRAFNDFDKVAVKGLIGGKTSKVYRVDAVPAAGGLRPLPFLAKIATRAKIIEEYDNFVVNVSDFVPFSARPNLIRERCQIGADSGILVGQFIEDSESLEEVVLRSSSPGVLHEVFEKLLHGWWRLGEKDAIKSDRSVLSGLENWFEAEGKKPRQEALEKHHGMVSKKIDDVLSPEQCSMRLRSILPTTHRRSLIHGDLHAGNIHVRSGEVYLIDFGSVTEGPILADAAMLEASLVLAAGVGCTKAAVRSQWETLTLEHLYRAGWDREAPAREPSMGVEASLRCLWAAIRVIRLHSFGMRVSPGEYAPLVAAAFFRLASFDDATPAERTASIAHLYGIASRIVSSTG